MQLSKDLLKFIQFLNDEQVEYLVVGGWAVGLHGKPRYTKDVDILVNQTPQNAKRIMTALERFGFGDLDISEADFLKPSYIIQLGVAPNRIDLLTSIAAVNFEEAYTNRHLVQHQNVEISLIGVKELISNKEQAARDQDLVDVKELKKLNGT